MQSSRKARKALKALKALKYKQAKGLIWWKFGSPSQCRTSQVKVHCPITIDVTNNVQHDRNMYVMVSYGHQFEPHI